MNGPAQANAENHAQPYFQRASVVDIATLAGADAALKRNGALLFRTVVYWNVLLFNLSLAYLLACTG